MNDQSVFCFSRMTDSFLTQKRMRRMRMFYVFYNFEWHAKQNSQKIDAQTNGIVLQVPVLRVRNHMCEV
jgi:hypothetical protein